MIFRVSTPRSHGGGARHQTVPSRTELLVKLGEEPSGAGNDIVHPVRHRSHVAKAIERIVKTLPEVVDASHQAVGAWCEHLEPSFDLDGGYQARILVRLAGETHLMGNPADAAFHVAVDHRGEQDQARDRGRMQRGVEKRQCPAEECNDVMAACPLIADTLRTIADEGLRRSTRDRRNDPPRRGTKSMM